jgi:hypothetical protein
MYGDDPRDFGLGPRTEDEERDPRAKFDEEDAYETNRPRTTLHDEEFYEE